MHPSHYGRMCPIETPEGPNIGLIGYLARYAAHQPVRLHRDAVPQDREGRRHRQRSSTSPPTTKTATSSRRRTCAIDDKGRFLDEKVLVRAGRGEVAYVDPHEVDYMDVSPKQIVSVATALIPFLEHDDANRALMGANMQRQAVPLLRRDRAVHRHRRRGPCRARRGRGHPRQGRRHRHRRHRRHRRRRLRGPAAAATTHRLSKFRRSNQGTCINQKPRVEHRRQGARGRRSSPTARRPTRASSRSARTSSSRSCRGRATTTRTRS